MTTGTVKWFNNEKKYGFILVGDQEIFVHFSAILKEGYKTLKKGQEVECTLTTGPKGVMAVDVKPLPINKIVANRKNQRRFFLGPPSTN